MQPQLPSFQIGYLSYHSVINNGFLSHSCLIEILHQVCLTNAKCHAAIIWLILLPHHVCYLGSKSFHRCYALAVYSSTISHTWSVIIGTRATLMISALIYLGFVYKEYDLVVVVHLQPPVRSMGQLDLDHPF